MEALPGQWPQSSNSSTIACGWWLGSVGARRGPVLSVETHALHQHTTSTFKCFSKYLATHSLSVVLLVPLGECCPFRHRAGGGEGGSREGNKRHIQMALCRPATFGCGHSEHQLCSSPSRACGCQDFPCLPRCCLQALIPEPLQMQSPRQEDRIWKMLEL